jgi:hypothetical protein
LEDLGGRQWNNIKLDLKEMGWGGLAWIYQAPRRRNLRAVVNTVVNLRVHDMRGVP